MIYFEKLKKASRKKKFWIYAFALIAMTGETFNIYKVPSGWDALVNAVILFLIAAGVIDDHEDMSE